MDNITELGKSKYNARLILEELIDQCSNNTFFRDFDIQKYINDKKVIDYFKSLLWRIKAKDLDLYAKNSKISFNKTNYFTSDGSCYQENVELFLEKIINKDMLSTNKPFVIIVDTQKDLKIKSELLTKCGVCFILNSEKQLDKQLNNHINVKIYDENNAKLALTSSNQSSHSGIGNFKIQYKQE